MKRCHFFYIFAAKIFPFFDTFLICLIQNILEWLATNQSPYEWAVYRLSARQEHHPTHYRWKGQARTGKTSPPQHAKEDLQKIGAERHVALFVSRIGRRIRWRVPWWQVAWVHLSWLIPAWLIFRGWPGGGRGRRKPMARSRNWRMGRIPGTRWREFGIPSKWDTVKMGLRASSTGHIVERNFRKVFSPAI